MTLRDKSYKLAGDAFSESLSSSVSDGTKFSQHLANATAVMAAVNAVNDLWEATVQELVHIARDAAGALDDMAAMPQNTSDEIRARVTAIEEMLSGQS